MGGFNDLGLWLIAHDERRQQVRRKLRLRMPRGHVDNQTLELAPRYTVKGVGHLRVVGAKDCLRPNVFHEVNEIVLGLALDIKLHEPQLKLSLLLLDLQRYS